MSDESEDVSESYCIDLSVGQVSVSVSGPDEEVVEELVNDKFEEGVKAAKELSLYESNKTYKIEAGAGHLHGYSEADSPEEALESWEDIWQQMKEDVEEFTERERELAGLSR